MAEAQVIKAGGGGYWARGGYATFNSTNFAGGGGGGYGAGGNGGQAGGYGAGGGGGATGGAGVCIIQYWQEA